MRGRQGSDHLHVLAREGVGGVGDQETGLTDGSISNDNTFDILHLCSADCCSRPSLRPAQPEKNILKGFHFQSQIYSGQKRMLRGIRNNFHRYGRQIDQRGSSELGVKTRYFRKPKYLQRSKSIFGRYESPWRSAAAPSSPLDLISFQVK
jgi:hypothetical protein